MNKEEAIQKIIDMAKGGIVKPFEAYCHSNPCMACPFQKNKCVESAIGGLIDRIIKTEESQKAETNLEHYIVRNGVHITKEPEVEVWEFRFKKGAEKQFFDANIKSVLDWLLSPYEKPKYKLSKFEHNLLECYLNGEFGIKDFWTLEQMQKKGCFNNIPTDVSIRDILDNCEVIEE